MGAGERRASLDARDAKIAAAVVKERFRREAMTSAFRILGEGQLALTKFLLVIDQPLDLADFRQVLEHLLARARFETDLFLIANLGQAAVMYFGGKQILVGTLTLGGAIAALVTDCSIAVERERTTDAGEAERTN